jgi:hypothetical protein
VPDRLADRRGEAHLWLVLEEALASATHAGDEHGVWDARRSFRPVADALMVVGAVEPSRAEAIVAELDDALAVRGLTVAHSFGGRAFPAWDPDRQPVRRRGDGWLEAEIEHHLDLVADIQPGANPMLGMRVLEVLGPAVRALQAAGALPHGPARLADVAATFHAAGFFVDAPLGEADRGWLGFLRSRPAPLTGATEPAASVDLEVAVGTMAGRPVVVRKVAWSESVLELDVDAPELPDTSLSTVGWRCSVFDDAGRLHLGQVGIRRGEGGPVVFRLRPGLMAGVSSMSVRITRGSERIEEQLWL